MNTLVPRSAGPWGGCSGKPWDDGVFTTTTRLIVHVDTNVSAITGLEVDYVKEKASFMSHHGDRAGSDRIIVIFFFYSFQQKLFLLFDFVGMTLNMLQINIDRENEFLIGVEGFYGPVVVEEVGGSAVDAIKQITFYTNKRKFGPYGRDIGTYFWSAAARVGEVVLACTLLVFIWIISKF